MERFNRAAMNASIGFYESTVINLWTGVQSAAAGHRINERRAKHVYAPLSVTNRIGRSLGPERMLKFDLRLCF